MTEVANKMTEKITLSVCVLGINKNCDFSVPINMSVREAIKLMKKVITEEYWGNSPMPESRINLMKLSDLEVLNDSLSFAQLGISSGERLIFV